MKATHTRLITALCVTLSCAAIAHASTYDFSFSFSGGGDISSGTLVASSTATAGQYLITGISGTINTVGIESILAPGIFPPDFGSNDNLLLYPPSPAYADFYGFSFADVNGTDYNIFYSSSAPAAYLVQSQNGATVLPTVTLSTFTVGTPVLVSASVAPEPESLVLVGSGMLGVVAVGRRRIRG